MQEMLLGVAGRRFLQGYGWVLTVVILTPAVILIPVSFSGQSGLVFPPSDFSLTWYDRLVHDPRWRDAALLSLEVAAFASVLATALGVQAALAIARMGAAAAQAMKLLFIAPMIVPLMVIGVGFYLAFAKLHLLGTFLSLGLAHTVLVLPFVLLPVSARLLSLDTILERAAASLGAGPFRTLSRIVVPLLLPAVAAGFVFAFIFSFDEVVVAQFLSGPTLETLPRLMWEGISVGGLDKTITAVTSAQIAIALLGIAALQIWRTRPRRTSAVIAGPDAAGTVSPDLAPAAMRTPELPSSSAHEGTGRGVDITFDRLTKRYADAVAVEEVSLHVRPGELLTILGPSGSGKTTLLMLVAGFLAPDAGRLLLGGRDISAVPPYRRDIGVVFQNYALFPHLDVRRNLAFPLQVRRLPAAEIDRRVRSALSLVHMERFADRRVFELSGGQQQRVALARAIVFGPRALLMDEPLAALDRTLRLAMQIEIRNLQRALGQTVVYVTHDQEEALNLSDRVAVMDGGRLQQVDTPRDLYLRPRNPFVAGFFGEANLFAGLARGETLTLANGTAVPLPCPCFDRAVLCVRPELIQIDTPAAHFPPLRGRVLETRFQASLVRMRIGTSAGEITATRQTTSPGATPELGAEVCVSWRPELTHVMKDET